MSDVYENLDDVKLFITFAGSIKCMPAADNEEAIQVAGNYIVESVKRAVSHIVSQTYIGKEKEDLPTEVSFTFDLCFGDKETVN